MNRLVKKLILLGLMWVGGNGILQIHAQIEQAISGQDADAGEILTVAQQMPRFPGCEDLSDKASQDSCTLTKMFNFVYTNLKYPKEARREGIEGTVVISFVIERDGTLSNINIARDIGGGCGEEVARIIQLINDKKISWIPGKEDGVPVRVQLKLPIKFKLQ